jgi:hypothetical protein
MSSLFSHSQNNTAVSDVMRYRLLMIKDKNLVVRASCLLKVYLTQIKSANANLISRKNPKNNFAPMVFA